MPPNKSLHRTPDASVTRLACATRAAAACAGQLRRQAASSTRTANLAAVKLENIESATIPVTKVRDYLLSQSHSIGRYKAAFFRPLGYEQANWEALANDLRSLLTGDAKQIGTTKYGVKYEIRGSITGPNGRTANVLLDYTDGRGNAKICDRVSRGLAHGH